MPTEQIALDTNVLVRVLVNDPDNPQQNKLARMLIKTFHKKDIYISQIVQVELVWVLKRYQFNKEEIIQVLEKLYSHPSFVLEYPERFLNALTLYKNNQADFSDYLIFSYANDYHCQLYSFDKALLKSKEIVIISPTSFD